MTSDQATIRAFHAYVGRETFPCVGAKAAAAHDQLYFVHARDLRSEACDRMIATSLQAFAARAEPDALFVSLVVTFPDTGPCTELEFEAALWARLQSIHDIDALSHRWDGSVSDDARSATFSMSVGGKAFYVIGLHPGASRLARRFTCPALIFNLHSQFELLRADGRYEKLRQAIAERDIAFSGSRNTMLSAHGTSSEARQYSGRQVNDAWTCPFKANQSRSEA